MNDNLKTQTEDNSTAIKLIQKDLSYMSSGITEIKDSIKELKDNMLNGFVSIEQFRNLQAEVRELKNLKDWAMRLVMGAIILAVLAVLGIGIGNK
jgi:hypothetical protein